jgi:hypothetical protein
MRSPRTFIAVVVTVVWAGLYGAEIVNPSFQPPAGVSSVMIIVVTWLFATEAWRKRNGR